MYNIIGYVKSDTGSWRACGGILCGCGYLPRLPCCPFLFWLWILVMGRRSTLFLGRRDKLPLFLPEMLSRDDLRSSPDCLGALFMPTLGAVGAPSWLVDIWDLALILSIIWWGTALCNLSAPPTGSLRIIVQLVLLLEHTALFLWQQIPMGIWKFLSCPQNWQGDGHAERREHIVNLPFPSLTGFSQGTEIR